MQWVMGGEIKCRKIGANCIFRGVNVLCNQPESWPGYKEKPCLQIILPGKHGVGSFS